MKRVSKIVLVVLAVVMCMSYHNEVKATATEVVWGQEYRGVINNAHSSHGYKIILAESGYITMNYTVNEDCYWELRDSDGKRLNGSNVYPDYTGSVDARVDVGTYYMYVYKPYSWMDNRTYTIKFSFQSANETFTYTNDFISDVSNKGSILYVTAINGHISIGETDDYYKLVVPIKGTITVDITTYNEDIYAMLCS